MQLDLVRQVWSKVSVTVVTIVAFLGGLLDKRLRSFVHGAVLGRYVIVVPVGLGSGSVSVSHTVAIVLTKLPAVVIRSVNENKKGRDNYEMLMVWVIVVSRFSTPKIIPVMNLRKHAVTDKESRGRTLITLLLNFL